MKKLVVFFLIMLSIVLGACNPNPTNVPTIEPTATPSPTPFVWSCENDPVRGVSLDLEGMYKTSIENRYVPGCTQGFFIGLSGEAYQINFLFKDYQAISLDNSFIANLETTVEWEIYAYDYFVPHHSQKKGDIISFVMPAPGYFLLDRNGYLYFGVFDDPNFEDYVRVFVDGEEWFASSTTARILLSPNGEYIVPEGATVRIESIKDAVDYQGLENYGTLGWIEAIVFERTYPGDTAKTNHPILNEETQIDFGPYGIYKPSFNEERNKWGLSLSEESMVKPGIWEEGYLRNFIWHGGAYVFYMPADGVVFWNRRTSSILFEGDETDSDTDKIDAHLYREGDLVVVYFERASLDDFYIEFLN